MRQTTLRPRAAALAESLRDLGYSLETAVSDIIDNSITARATQIDIWCLGSAELLSLAIVDDGIGMDEPSLLSAMRPGSSDPREDRETHDLGRFGLGLKTASFSQARKLTVVSKTAGLRPVAARWNLDQVGQQDEWLLDLLDEQEIVELPWFETLPGDSGTMVLWQDLDRFVETLHSTERAALIDRKLADLARHISLVFHRFLAGECPSGRRMKIRINGKALKPFDPFCRSHSATQVLPTETLRTDGSVITLQPFILPHHSKLSAETLDHYKTRGDFISSQGAYVYRNCRLMVWGDWFRLIPKGEATKLARVKIDFTSEQDDAWTIDIKKSRAYPPPAVRSRFRQIIERIADQSLKVFTGRATRSLATHQLSLWERTPGRNGFNYSPNTSHPMIARLEEQLSTSQIALLHQIFQSLGCSLPVEAIYADQATGHDGRNRDEATSSELENDFRSRLTALVLVLDPGLELPVEEFLMSALSTRIFDSDEPLARRIAEELYR